MTIGFTINDCQSCKAGTSNYFNKTHIFDPNIKITKVEVIINKIEWGIHQINFFSGEEKLVVVGWNDDDVERNRGRVETFEIAANEQLIGCELDHGTLNSGVGNYFLGVTWLKWKIN